MFDTEMIEIYFLHLVTSVFEDDNDDDKLRVRDVFVTIYYTFINFIPYSCKHTTYIV